MFYDDIVHELGEIMQNKGHFAVQGHLRSPIFVPIESSYTASYRGRRAVSLQTFTTRHSNRKLSIVMALSTTFTQYAPESTKFF